MRKVLQPDDGGGVLHRMTAKEYLKQMWWLDREINEKIKEMDYLKTKAEGCSAPAISGTPRQTVARDRLSDLVIKIVDLQTYINMQTDKLIDLRSRITKQICRMKRQEYRVILSCRYLRCMKWNEIEKELSYERRNLMRIHDRAVAEFEAIYPEIKKLR